MRRSILQGCRITSKKGSCQGHQTITKTFRLAMSLFEVNISNKTSFKSHHHKISLRKRAWRRILLPLNRNLLLPWIKRENQFKKVFTTISCKWTQIKTIGSTHMNKGELNNNSKPKWLKKCNQEHHTKMNNRLCHCKWILHMIWRMEGFSTRRKSKQLKVIWCWMSRLNSQRDQFMTAMSNVWGLNTSTVKRPEASSLTRMPTRVKADLIVAQLKKPKLDLIIIKCFKTYL